MKVGVPFLVAVLAILCSCASGETRLAAIGRPPTGAPPLESTKADSQFSIDLVINPGGGQIKEFHGDAPTARQFVTARDGKRYEVRRHSGWDFTAVRTSDPRDRPILYGSAVVATYWNDADPAAADPNRPMSQRAYRISLWRGDERLLVLEPTRWDGKRRKGCGNTRRIHFTPTEIPGPVFEAMDTIHVTVMNEQFLPCEWPPKQVPPPPSG